MSKHCIRTLIAMVVVMISTLFSHTAARNSHIKGEVVTYSTGQPLDGVKIRIFDAAWDYLSDVSTFTDPNGSYITGALDPGLYYARAVPEYPMAYVPTYWPSSIEKKGATPILVEEGVDTEGANFELIQGGFIRGSIDDATGSPLEDVDLDIYDSAWHWISAISDFTEDDGTYCIGAFPPGQYYIRADPALNHGVQQRYWPDAYYRDEATPVTVSAGEDLSGINLILPKGAVIQGKTIQSINELAAPGCKITVYNLNWREQPIHSITSTVNGDYSAFGLPSGSYYMFAEGSMGSGAGDAYFPNAIDPINAETVTIAAGDILENTIIFLPEGNFEIDIELLIPSKHFDPGDTFYLSLRWTNHGIPLKDMPVFCLLELHDIYYFWPSWNPFSPPEFTGIDYDTTDMVIGSETMVILPVFTWPITGISISDISFIAAVTNRSISGLASPPHQIEWSFD